MAVVTVPNMITDIPRCKMCSGMDAPRPFVGLFHDGGMCIQLWCPEHGNLLVARLDDPITTSTCHEEEMEANGWQT